MHQRPPTEVRLCAVTPTLEVRYAPPPEPHPTALGTPHVGRMVYELTEADEGGEYWVVFGGWDDSAAWRRDHRVRAMMAVNRPKRRFSAHGYDQLGDKLEESPMAMLGREYHAVCAGEQRAGYVLGYTPDPREPGMPGALLGDRVMYHRSHGRVCGGYVLCAEDSRIFSNRSGRTTGGAHLIDWDLSFTLFVVWNGCYTGDNNSLDATGKYGNLAHRTALQGVHAVLGFHGETAAQWLVEDRFFYWLFEYLIVNDLSVQQAYDQAVQKLRQEMEAGGELYWVSIGTAKTCEFWDACIGGGDRHTVSSDRFGYDAGVLFGSPVHTKISPAE